MTLPDAPETGPDAGADFLVLVRRYLCEEYPAKLRIGVSALPGDDLWWRPNPESNSVGNLVLHLAGNVRQWVVAGVGGREDVRRRAQEFAAGAGTVDEVLGRLDAVLKEVAEVLDELRPGDLVARRRIQGLEVGVQEALLHVVEHFSMHLGQILWIAKARSGRDLGLYEVDADGSVVDTHW